MKILAVSNTLVWSSHIFTNQMNYHCVLVNNIRLYTMSPYANDAMSSVWRSGAHHRAGQRQLAVQNL